MFAKNSKLCFMISLAILLTTILIVLLGFPKIIQKQIQKQVQIDNSSMMYEKWRKLPIPLSFKIYVFNVTNREEINNGEKPRLQEIGPFVYQQYREKTVLGYGPNDTIKYMLKRRFVFDKEASGGLNEDDELTVINFSYMAAILQVYDMAPGFVSMVNPALEIFFPNLEDPFMTVKMKDLFFDGIFLNCNANHSALVLVCGKIKADMPQTMRPAEDGTGYYFSMFGHLNNTEAGPFEVIRGTQDITDLGRIVSYDGKTNTVDKWEDNYCGMINGTDSSIFPPIDENNVPTKLYTFEPDLCRSIYVDLVEQRTQFNMTAYYYETSEAVLASKSANKDNKCFCKRNWSGSHDGCLLMGVLNLMPCQGAPAIASFPHFYMASEELLEYFDEGIAPNKDKHSSFVYLDPSTGVVMKGAKRLQFNIELRRMAKVPQLENVPTGVFPLMWIEEGAELNQELIEELQSGHKLLNYAEIGRWVLLALVLGVCALSGLAVMKTQFSICRRYTDSVSFVPNGVTHSKGF